MKQSGRRGRHPSQRLGLWLAAAALALSLLTLLVLTEFTHTFTWSDVFEFAGLVQTDGAQAEQGGPAPEQPAIDSLGDGVLRVSVLDVGQADSILIESGDFVALIDAGDYFSERAIADGLRARGIARIDLLVATHPHRDHIGGMAALIGEFEIGKVLFTTYSDELTPTNTTYMNLLNALIDASFQTVTAATGEVIEMPLGALTVLSAGGYNELNDCSLVIRCDYGETSFLLTGDAGFAVENAMMADGLPLACDVLKAGHHGSKYATSAAFLEAVGPAYVAVSCGVDNQYGYPTEEFLDRVQAAGAAVLRTDLDGDIVFLSDGASVRAATETKEAA